MLFLAVLSLAALLTSGCAELGAYNTATETKLGRGLNNTYEIVRMGEMRRTIEQTSVFGSLGDGFTVGAVRGFDRSLERTGLGVWETATFPLPLKYDPVASGYSKLWGLTPDPVFPESYKPVLLSDPLFDTDTYTGFSGGDIAPFIPGSRFRVFDN